MNRCFSCFELLFTRSLWFFIKVSVGAAQRDECLCYQITKNKEIQHSDHVKQFTHTHNLPPSVSLSLSLLDSSAVDTESAAINHSLLEHAQSYRSTQPCQALLSGDTSCPHSFSPQHGSSAPSVPTNTLCSSEG